jgi:ribosomal protein L11 methyltransferase
VSYVALRFVAAAAQADAWSDALLDAGALSVDLADAADGAPGEAPLFGEPGERDPQPGDWSAARITAMIAGEADASAVLAHAALSLGVAPPICALSVVDDTDWVRAAQAQFAPIEVAPRVWIVPSWREPVDAGAINVVLDPGLAFGTGSHPTTRLVAQWLAGELRAGESVLDYGCGSGILAIVAAKLGAGRVMGTDVDANALAASRANARRNRVAACFCAPGDALLRRAKAFDVVVANILANPLRLLAPALAARVRAGGRLVLSGILAAQAEELIAAYAPWFKIAVWRGDEHWVALAGARRSARTPR